MSTVELKPSRSETFPYAERTFVFERHPVTYFDSGGTGPAVVFVHGLGANLTHFEYVAPPLAAAGYRVCGLDLPGFGASGKPDRAYSIDHFAAAVLALMDHLGIEHATLCGHSLGGLVVAHVALRVPGRVDHLVLISSAGLFKMPVAVAVAARTLLRPSLVAPMFERNAARLLGFVFAENNSRTRRFIEQSTTRPDPDFCPALARVMWSARRDLTSYHLLSDGARFTMPTLVIWGGRDRLLPFGAVPAWAAQLPDGELEVLARCGHMPIIEDPEPVVARTLEFLARRGSRPMPPPSHATPSAA